MKYNPYYNQDEFRQFKYQDQPVLRLLDWQLKRVQKEAQTLDVEILRERLRRLLLAQIETDLTDLSLDLRADEKKSDELGVRYELMGDIGGVMQVRATLVVPHKRHASDLIFVCLHGHQHEGRRWTLDEGPAAALVRAGYACLAPDCLGLGETRGATEDAARGAVAYDLVIHDALLLGWTLNGLRLWVLRQWMDVLRDSARFGERPRRFACAGFSLGGELALYLSALDTTIALVYVSHYACPWEESYWAKLHCKCAYAPGLLRLTSLDQVYRLIAPRPLAVEVGREDASFPWPGTARLIDQVKEQYASLGCPDNLAIAIKQDGHAFRCEPQTLAFLARSIAYSGES